MISLFLQNQDPATYLPSTVSPKLLSQLSFPKVSLSITLKHAHAYLSTVYDFPITPHRQNLPIL